MAQAVDMRKLIDEIRALREDVSVIKQQVLDPDCLLTKEEAKRFDKSLVELRDGKTIPLSKLKKELRL